MIGAFQSRLFDEALRISGRTKRELADAIGVTAGRVSQFETKPPTGDLLAKVANELGVRPEFFQRSDLPEATDPFFRRLSRTPAGVRERYRSIARLVGEAVRLSGIARTRRDLPDLRDLPAAAAAAEFRAELGLQPDEPLVSVVRMLEARGVWVHELDIDDEALVDAFCTFVDGLPVVFLNPVRADPYRARHNGGHELCHLTRHDLPASDGAERKLQEDEANEFGGELLLPVAVWRDLAPRRGLTNPWTYLTAKQRFGISVKALIVKTHTAGLIDDSEYRYALMRYGSMAWNSGEPMPDSDDTQVYDRPCLAGRLLDAFGTAADLASALDISVDLAHTVLGVPQSPSPVPRLRLVPRDD